MDQGGESPVDVLLRDVAHKARLKSQPSTAQLAEAVGVVRASATPVHPDSRSTQALVVPAGHHLQASAGHSRIEATGFAHKLEMWLET